MSGDDLPSAHDLGKAILPLRDMRVILDEDLARFYGRTLSAFNQAVKRNEDLFEGYRFQLTAEEVAELQSQDVIAKRQGRGGRSSLPWVYND